MVGLFGGKLFERLQELLGLAGGSGIRIEEFLGSQAEVIANVKKSGKGWQCPPVFDFIDITLALPKGQAHISGGNALQHPQLCQPVIKPINVIQSATSLDAYSINPFIVKYIEYKDILFLTNGF